MVCVSLCAPNICLCFWSFSTVKKNPLPLKHDSSIQKQKLLLLSTAVVCVCVCVLWNHNLPNLTVSRPTTAKLFFILENECYHHQKKVMIQNLKLKLTFYWKCLEYSLTSFGSLWWTNWCWLMLNDLINNSAQEQLWLLDSNSCLNEILACNKQIKDTQDWQCYVLGHTWKKRQLFL